MDEWWPAWWLRFWDFLRRPWVEDGGMLLGSMEVLGNRWDQGGDDRVLGFLEERERGTRTPFCLREHHRPSPIWALGGSRGPCTEAGPHWG